MTQFEMIEHRPAETNAIEDLSEYIHAAEVSAVDDRTQHPDD
jgi:hypothetical protein